MPELRSDRNGRTIRRTGSLLLALGAMILGLLWWSKTRTSPATEQYERGRKLQTVNLKEEALEAYREAIRLKPGYAPPYRAIAEMATQNRDNSTAIDWWKAFLQRDPMAKHAWCRLAQAEALIGREKSAMADAEQELKLDASCSRANLALGILYARKSDAAPALQHLVIAAQTYPDDPQVQMVYGKVLALSGDYPKAETVLQHVITLDTRHAEPYHWLGYVYARRSTLPADARQAEVFLRQALTLNPEMPDANYELGRLLLQQRQTQKAIPYLLKAVERKRHNIGGLFSLAQAYTLTGQRDKARQVQKEFQSESDFAAREKALLKQYVVNPQDVELKLKLGLLEIDRNEPRAALIFLDSDPQAATKDARLSAAAHKAEKMLADAGQTQPSAFPQEPQ